MKLHRHERSFLTLEETAKERRGMPYLKTFEYPGRFIDQTHGEIAAVKERDNKGHYILRGVPGRLNYQDAMKLYEMAYFCGGDVLEIGCLYGLSAFVSLLAVEASGRDSRIVSVDLHQGCVDTARQNLSGKPGADKIEFYRADGARAVTEFGFKGRRFNFAFVDHDHHLKPVYEVCRRLHRVLKPGAFALFHDYNDPRNSDPRRREYAVYQGVEDGLSKDYFEFWGIYGCAGLFRRTPTPATHPALARRGP